MYSGAKVYNDGSHFIAIPYIPKPKRVRKIYKKIPSDLFELMRNKEIEQREEQEKQAAKQAYEEVKDCKGQERIDKAVAKLKEKCIPVDKAKELVEDVKAKRDRQITEKKKRFFRKAMLNDFNYFVTFTYDDKKHTESSFKKGLIERLSRLTKDNGWKYAGVWEISPNERLHFHCFIYVPEGKMVGTVETRKDYSTKTHRMQEYNINTYFEKAFGRNDFRSLERHPILYDAAIKYILKYITKTNERIVYSKNLPMYLISDINEEDELCRMGVDDRKILLPDDFECWDEGEYLGRMCNEVKFKMRTTSH